MTVKKGYKGQLFYAPCLHTFQAAIAGADAAAVARLRSDQLCVDPGLSGLADADTSVSSSSRNGDRSNRGAENGQVAGPSLDQELGPGGEERSVSFKGLTQRPKGAESSGADAC